MEKYKLISILGAGGGGKVHLAKDIESGKHVAIKEINLDPHKKTKTKETVQKEAKILASLKHPHVVSMLESFLDDNEDQLFIVQDYCDGGTLKDPIDAAKKDNVLLSESQIMQWFVQVTMAVHHIHANKILHRDIKAQNVFLTKKGVAKIGDFGIARTLESTVDMAQTCCGTPCYLSPELCQDMPYSSKADVWSLGCLLYELCALKYAFDANNLVSLYYKIVKGEPEDLSQQYSQSLRDLIGNMLAKKPEDRLSAGAILNLAFVQKHVASFIKEKEHIQEAIHARQHLKLVGTPCKISGDELVRPSSALGPSLTPDSANKPIKRAKSALSTTRNVPIATNNDREKVPTQDDAQQDGYYSDDFDESEDEDETIYLDDFEDDSTLSGSLKKPIGISPVGGGEGEQRNIDNEYPDDFEEDSDEEEVLDDIIANARAARDVKEEDVVEDIEESVSCKQRLKEQVIGALGEKVFEEVYAHLENSSVDRTLADRPEFEETQLGSNLMETCVLVNELFIDNSSSTDS